MSTGYIITTIAVMFGLLLAFAFISQMQQRRNEQRNRLASALKVRSKKIMNLLASQPKHFLSVDLQVLLLNQLLETSETLVKLEPKAESHKKNIAILTERLIQVQSPANASKNVKITEPEKIKNAHKSLEELYLFVRGLAQKQEIPADDANRYNSQIKQLTFGLSTSYNEVNAKHELKEGRTKLALQYFTQLANLHKENSEFGDQGRITELDQLITELTEQFEEEARLEQEKTQSEGTDASESTNGFEQGDDLWKKRNVYD